MNLALNTFKGEDKKEAQMTGQTIAAIYTPIADFISAIDISSLDPTINVIYWDFDDDDGN